MLIAISLVLLLTPFVVVPGWQDGIRYPKEIFSVIALAAIIGTGLTHKLKPFKNKYLILLWIWCFVTLVTDYYFLPVYLKNVEVLMPSIFFMWKEIVYITLSIFTIYTISSYETNENLSLGKFVFDEAKSIEIVSKIVSIAVIVMSAYAIIQACGFDEFFRVANGDGSFVAGAPLDPKALHGALSHRIVGSLGNPALLGIWIAMCLPLCLYLRRKIGYIAFSLGLLAILLTRSMTAYLGAIVAISVWLFFYNRKTFYAFILSICCISMVLVGSPALRQKSKTFINPKGRIEVHKKAFEILREKPMTGLGLGTFEYLIGNNPKTVEELGNQSWKELHDEFGQAWFSLGIIGLGLFLTFIGSTVLSFLKNIRLESLALISSLAAFLVMSFAYFNFRVAPISTYGVILTGLLLRTIGDKDVR